jgi:hypothetical protein
MRLSIGLTIVMVALEAVTAVSILLFTNRALENIVGARPLVQIRTHVPAARDATDAAVVSEGKDDRAGIHEPLRHIEFEPKKEVA